MSETFNKGAAPAGQGAMVAGLSRTREQWSRVDPEKCANENSKAANFYLLRDAKSDIEKLHMLLQTAPALSYKDDRRTPVELSNAGCRCVRFGEGNPHWPCRIHAGPTQDEREAPVVVATAILGGLFHGGSGPELGEIDIDPCMPALEALQCETVNSSDDVFLPLMTVAQHERIVAAMAAEAAEASEQIDNYKSQFGELHIARNMLSRLSAAGFEIGANLAESIIALRAELAALKAAAPAQDVQGLPVPDITTKHGYPAYSVELVSRLLARPAQTEQQPVAFRKCRVISFRPGMGEVTLYVKGGVTGFMDPGCTIYVSDAAPIAQTAPAPLAVSLSDDDRSALHQLAFELGGTEGGEYLLDAAALDELIAAALSAQRGEA